MESKIDVFVTVLTSIRVLLSKSQAMYFNLFPEAHIQCIHQLFLKFVIAQVSGLKVFSVAAANGSPKLRVKVKAADANTRIYTIRGHADLIVGRSRDASKVKTAPYLAHHIEMKKSFGPLRGAATAATKQLVAENMGFREMVTTEAQKNRPMVSYLCDIMSIRMCVSIGPNSHYVEESVTDARAYILRILYAMRSITAGEGETIADNNKVRMAISRQEFPPPPPPRQSRKRKGNSKGTKTCGISRKRSTNQQIKGAAAFVEDACFDDHEEDERTIRALQEVSDALNRVNGLRSRALRRQGSTPRIDGSLVPAWTNAECDYYD
jgi:hypothetical protein